MNEDEKIENEDDEKLGVMMLELIDHQNLKI